MSALLACDIGFGVFFLAIFIAVLPYVAAGLLGAGIVVAITKDSSFWWLTPLIATACGATRHGVLF